jgi:hypothetical protein
LGKEKTMYPHYRRLLFGVTVLSIGGIFSWGGTNTSMGTNAGAGGSNNSFFGVDAGKVTTGARNTFFGYSAGSANTAGVENTFFGEQSGKTNNGGGSSNNTYFGYQAGRLVDTAFGMVCVGWRSGNNSNKQNANTFIGAQAGDNSNYANSSVGLGAYAAADGNNSDECVAVGGKSHCNGKDYNTLVGWNTRGAGDHNVIVGAGNPDYNTNSNLRSRNVMVGNNPLLNMNSSTPGDDNVMLGVRAGEKLKEGNRNTFVGNRAGNNITYGHDNVILGHEAQSQGDRSFVVSNYAFMTPLITGDFYHGMITFRQLVVTGGGDVVEAFQSEEKPEPGTVVSLDSRHEGKLRVAREAYDTKVAGIVSGAGGIRSGFKMRKENTHLDGPVDLALRGRVYCRADAAYGAIRPGDLLTSSRTPGHAMKVGDYRRGRGAFIGKAMSSLEKGKGLVLVLVRD